MTASGVLSSSFSSSVSAFSSATTLSLGRYCSNSILYKSGEGRLARRILLKYIEYIIICATQILRTRSSF